MLRSPFKWAGGKLRIRKEIISLLPAHDCYVEVFGGAGWVLFGKEPSKVEIFNDLDGEVVNFFEVVRDMPEELIRSFELELVSRARFTRLRDMSVESSTKLQRAHRFYYLIMASWGGELGNPRFQTSVSDGGHGNRLIGALKTLRKRIEPIHERLQTVIIENLDWRECIERYDRGYESKKVVMYLDPPYPRNTINYHYNMRSETEHKELAKVLRDMRSRFLLTSYDLPEVREIYSTDAFHVKSVDFAAGMPTHNRKRSRNKEIIISNFVPNGDESS